MKRKFIIFTLLQLIITTIAAQTALTTYRPGLTAEGAVYYLPKTAIRITVRIEKTSYQPGDFCRYAQRYLRMNDVAQKPSVAYRVVDIRQQTVAMADTSKAYSVKFDAKTAASNIILSDDGVLLAINAEPRRLPSEAAFTPAPQPELPNPRQFMSEEILSAGSTSKMAELTAREIYDLRENRNLLIKGQADFMPKDGEQLRLMLNQLELQDRALSSLFVGTTQCDTTEHSFLVCPTGTSAKRVLFRLSQHLGLVDSDDLSGRPFYVSVDDLQAALPKDETAAKQKKKKVESGIYVNVPGKMRATLYDGITPVSVMEHPAPQFGHVELLSGDLFNKRYTTHLRLHPLTGAIEKLEAETPKK